MPKLVLVSDTHGFHRQVDVPDGDIFIHAGDFMLSGGQEEVRIVQDFNNWLSELPHKHKLVTCGNHDRLFHRFPEAHRLITNATLLIDAVTEVEGLRVGMYPWTPRFPEDGRNWWAFMKPRKDMWQVWEKVPEGLDALVTHGPPQGILDTLPDGTQCGDWYLRRQVFDRIKPRVHVFGHIHEGYGSWLHIEHNNTERNVMRFFNASVVDGAYRVKKGLPPACINPVQTVTLDKQD